MLDIKFLRENPDVVKQNIKNKFQDSKLPLVDEVIELDKRNREIKGEVEALRAEKNKISKMIGTLMKEGKREEAEEVKKQVTANAETVDRLSAEEKEVEEKIKKIMMTIPNIIDPSVPIGKDDSENVEVQRYGEPVVPDFEIPYHAEIMEKFNGLDLDSARKVAGNGFYYLMGDIARLHSAVISYARDFMINRGFTYCVPPFMIRSDVVTGVMSFAEMDAMMYKIEGEDFRIVGTSARVEEGETTENGVTLRLKTADKIKAFTRVRLPKQPTDIKAIDEDGEAVAVESSWDEETKTLLVSYQSVSKEVCVTGKWA
jgi:seryl-tRNA synthetase